MDEKIVILTGAGISKPSGISTFRDSDGLWEKHNIEDICSSGCLDKNYEATIKFYDQRREDIKDKKPNIAHKTIAKLKQKYKNKIEVITQNVDDLFEKANCDDVLHLHGYLPLVKCTVCENSFSIDYNRQFNTYTVCKNCGNKLRPDIVFFGEMAPKYEDMYKALENCGLLVVIGTSGYVIDVSFLTQWADFTILNNFEKSEAIVEECFNKIYYECATTAIEKIEQDIEKFIEKKYI